MHFSDRDLVRAYDHNDQQTKNCNYSFVLLGELYIVLSELQWYCAPLEEQCTRLTSMKNIQGVVEELHVRYSTRLSNDLQYLKEPQVES